MNLKFVDYHRVADRIKNDAEAIKKVAKDVNDHCRHIQNISEAYANSMQEIHRITESLKTSNFQ